MLPPSPTEFFFFSKQNAGFARLRDARVWYQPFKHVAEELLDKRLLLVMVETGQLGAEGLAEKVCLHPGAFHKDLLIVEDLEEKHVEV